MKYLYLFLVSTTLLLASDPKSLEVNTDNLIGKWESIGGEMNGIKVDKEFGKTFIEFDKEKITLNGGNAVKYSIDNTKNPTTIDIHTTPMQVGILKFVNGQLYLCCGKEGHRPIQFKSDEGDDCAYLVMKKR